MGRHGWFKKAHTVFLLCATTALASSAKTTFTTLVNFDGTNGAKPLFTSLVQGTDGDYYGTTSGGGAKGAGTVFKVTSKGTLTTLYSFCSQPSCPDGSNPYAGLVQAIDGEFYGTTTGGGASVFGTVFKITPGGTLTLLHSFDLTDGALPAATLVQGTDRYFYGTTSQGGPHNNGTVFKISSKGALTTLHFFDGTDGSVTFAALVQSTNGEFYGTAPGGVYGYGTVFKITSGGTFTTLYNFNSTDGSNPNGSLVQATNGSLYGTTSGGGAGSCNNGCGTVFKITQKGTLTTVHSFDPTEGTQPGAGLIQATDGNFYGTTYAGGASNWGTVFRMTPAGKVTVLHSFDLTDGAQPSGPLAQATSGRFYGVTSNGGTNNDGTVFSLSVGLGPFVETRPTSGKVGTPVIILGTNLKGTTSVTFNGTAAQFTVVSKSEINTKVPTGATTGKVNVMTPRGTLLSNMDFRVKQ